VVTGAVVAATRAPGVLRRGGHCLLCACLPVLAGAGVLPDDRADVLYHSYNGGGVEITGPSLLVLKKVGQNVAVTGNYYVDSVSSASIDVVTSGASKYSEDRTEVSAGIDYLHDNSTISLSYTNSDENDYQANTAGFGVSMDMFGNMTTVTLGYLRSWDTVENNTDPAFSEDVDRQNYQLGLTQVITPDILMEVNFETITDEGYLNNPYRSVRYLDSASEDGYSFQPEVYPRTRTSNALAVRSRYYLPYRAALSGEYRFFDDSWGINAHNLEVGYIQPLESGWILEANIRYYTQSAADFYSDLFPRMNAQNFMARDKELSDFRSYSVGFTLGYDLLANGWHFIDSGSVNLSYEHIWYDYNDFRDLRDVASVPGTEPLYSFSADVALLYLSLWF
jgi:hypothetical protein